MSDTEPQTAAGKFLLHFAMSLDGLHGQARPRAGLAGRHLVSLRPHRRVRRGQGRRSQRSRLVGRRRRKTRSGEFLSEADETSIAAPTTTAASSPSSPSSAPRATPNKPGTRACTTTLSDGGSSLSCSDRVRPWCDPEAHNAAKAAAPHAANHLQIRIFGPCRVTPSLLASQHRQHEW